MLWTISTSIEDVVMQYMGLKTEFFIGTFISPFQQFLVSEAKIVQRRSKAMSIQSFMTSKSFFLKPIIKKVVKNEQSSLKHIKKYHIM